MLHTKPIKIITFLLCLVMVLGLTACAQPTPSPSPAATMGSTAPQDSAAPAQATPYPETTLTAFVQQSVSSDSGIWQGWGAQRLYEDTGIKIDFYPTGNEVEQKLKQYLAGGSLPDIIGFKGLDQAQYAMDADMLLALNEHEDKLPNIFDNELYADAIAYSKDFTSNDTGNLYIVPTAVGPASYNAYNWVPLLQWDAYKKAGSPQINTLEDYLDVVEAMVAQKPTTPEGEKVYGFSLFSDWDKYTALEVSTLSFFYGIDTEYVSHLMETNVITKEAKSLLAQDSFYKRALKFYFDANQRGLLDPDSMTQTFSNVDAKYSAGRVMFSHFSWMTGSYNSNASGYVTNEEAPDGYANVPANDMKIYEAPDQTIGRNWYFAISKNAKEIDRACQLLDWLYNVEVNQYLSNGPIGVTWDLDEKGEPFVTEDGWKIIDSKNEPLMPAEIGGGAFQDAVNPFNTLGAQASTIMENGYTLSYRYWPTSPLHNINAMKLENNELLSKWSGKDVVVLADYVIPQGMVAKSTQAVNMIPPISDEMEMTISQIGEIVKKFSWQMIYSANEAEFEKLWTEMTTQAEGLGMANVVSYYEQAWKDALAKVGDYE